MEENKIEVNETANEATAPAVEPANSDEFTTGDKALAGAIFGLAAYGAYRAGKGIWNGGKKLVGMVADKIKNDDEDDEEEKPKPKKGKRIKPVIKKKKKASKKEETPEPEEEEE